ncbi:MAG: hypothetical protein ACR2M3_20105 [Thermomicrobiales bacterium]
MATRTFPEETPGDVTAAPTTEDDLDDDSSFPSSAEEKPKTGRELYKEDFMAAQKHVSEETHEEKVADEATWEFPSSSPDKKILTGRALLESGLVGLWKDRTDIGDTLEYVQKLKDQGRRRRQKRIRKYMPS